MLIIGRRRDAHKPFFAAEMAAVSRRLEAPGVMPPSRDALLIS
jgi:hypothetical protein